jgi:hypothetical protein
MAVVVDAILLEVGIGRVFAKVLDDACAGLKVERVHGVTLVLLD